jgi:hypothetical protein
MDYVECVGCGERLITEVHIHVEITTALYVYNVYANGKHSV